VRAEIHHHVALVNDAAKVVTLVNLGNDFQLAKTIRARNQRPAHPALRSGDNDASHKFNAKAQRRADAEKNSDSSKTSHLCIFALYEFILAIRTP
jgi:hypothetical protein